MTSENEPSAEVDCVAAAERALVGAALHSVRHGGPVLAARPAAEFCLGFAKNRVEAATAALREQLDAERETMRKERDELAEKLKLAEAFDQARLSQIKHAEFATFAAQENYANASKERDAARAEAGRLMAEGAVRQVRHDTDYARMALSLTRAGADAHDVVADQLDAALQLLRECEPEVADRRGAMHVDMPWSWWERRTAALAREPKP